MKKRKVTASATMETYLHLVAEFTQEEIDKGLDEYDTLENWLRNEHADSFKQEEYALSGDFRVYDAEVEDE